MNLAEGTTVKAQVTTATAVACKAGGVVGYFEACGRLTFSSNLDLWDTQGCTSLTVAVYKPLIDFMFVWV